MSANETETQNNFEKYSEYYSKSRLKTWVTCPRKFYYKYVEKIDTPETESMVRGTDIHELIEYYYENIEEYAKDNSEPPTTLFSLLNTEEHDNWREYLDPYLAHFLAFERRRWDACQNMSDWIPVSVEDEIWTKLYSDRPILMGFADVLLPAASINSVATNEGCVLIDFKTGKSNENYMGHEEGGVYLDLAYYAMIFESKYDIVAVGAYYPLEDKLVTSGIKEEREKFIDDITSQINNADEDNITDYPIDEQPLCAWGAGEDERCAFYEECDSTWAEPIDNADETVEYIMDGLTNKEIADELDTTEQAVNYWVNKKRWHRYR